jgi:hypothetical protein
LKLLKDDIVSLLRFRNVEHKKSETKAALLTLLLKDAFAGEPDDVIVSILARYSASKENADVKLASRLSKNSDLSDAVDALASMDPDTAQAFPELTKAQKFRRDPGFQKWVAKERVPDSSSSSDSSSDCEAAAPSSGGLSEEEGNASEDQLKHQLLRCDWGFCGAMPNMIVWSVFDWALLCL